MDYTVHGILQARILEWVAFPFSRGSTRPRDQTQVSRIAGGFFNKLSHKINLTHRIVLRIRLICRCLESEGHRSGEYAENRRFHSSKNKKDTTLMDISLHVIIHLLKAIECTAPSMSPT